MSAWDMAEQVGEGSISLESALSWHLTSNHYPPHHPGMVGVAVAAIEAVLAGDEDKEIALDFDGAPTYKGRTSIMAHEAVEALHLDHFLS